jgi:hypothetical protein
MGAIVMTQVRGCWCSRNEPPRRLRKPMRCWFSTSDSARTETRGIKRALEAFQAHPKSQKSFRSGALFRTITKLVMPQPLILLQARKWLSQRNSTQAICEKYLAALAVNAIVTRTECCLHANFPNSSVPYDIVKDLFDSERPFHVLPLTVKRLLFWQVLPQSRKLQLIFCGILSWWTFLCLYWHT